MNDIDIITTKTTNNKFYITFKLNNYNVLYLYDIFDSLNITEKEYAENMKNFGAFLFRERICYESDLMFNNENDVKSAVEWLKSLIILNKLGE